jgi:tetratricopeptide (TPR) repeat protein
VRGRASFRVRRSADADGISVYAVDGVIPLEGDALARMPVRRRGRRSGASESEAGAREARGETVSLRRRLAALRVLPVVRPAATIALRLWRRRTARGLASSGNAAEHAARRAMPAAARDALVEALGLLEWSSVRDLADTYAALDLHGAGPLPLVGLLDGRGGADARVVAERRLRDVVGACPDAADAWLALGQIHDDRGERDAALACFERALAGRAYVPLQAGDVQPLTLAWAGRARSLEAAGNLADAAAAYERALGAGAPASIALRCARLAARRDAIDNALACYDRAMTWSIPAQAGASW